MAELTYRDAVARGIAQEMARDPDVIFFGEDVAKAGGVFKTTVGLLRAVRPEARARLPDLRAGDPGRRHGRGDDRLKPIAEIMFSGFLRGLLRLHRQRVRQEPLHVERPAQVPAGGAHRQRRGLALRRPAQPERRELGDDDPRPQGGGAVDPARRDRPAGRRGARSRSGDLLRAQVALSHQGRGAGRRDRRHARHRQDRASRQGRDHPGAGADGAARARRRPRSSRPSTASTARWSTCARWCRSTPRPSSARSAHPPPVHGRGEPAAVRLGRRDRLDRGGRGVLRPRRAAGADHHAAHPAAGRRHPGGHRAADRRAHRRARAAARCSCSTGRSRTCALRSRALARCRLAIQTRQRRDRAVARRERAMHRRHAMLDTTIFSPTCRPICGSAANGAKASDGGRFDVLDPATENKIASVASATVEDAKAAVDAASDAFAGWAARKPRERAEILRKSFELIMRDAERLAKLITIENGKALSDRAARSPMPPSSSAGTPRRRCAIIGQVSRAPASGARIVVQHKPAGVAVLVTPWNFPAAMATRKIGPALAAGCPVVLKPASDTPLTMLALMPILEEAGVPAGVVNVIPSRSSGKVVERDAARSARARGLVHRLDRGRPQAAARGRRQRGQAGDGARRQRAVHRVRGRRHRRRHRRRHDRQDAQHGRGLHRGQPLLRAREGARRVRQEAHRQDGGAQGRQRARRRRVRRAAGQRRRHEEGDRAGRRRGRQGRQGPHRRQVAGRPRASSIRRPCSTTCRTAPRC